MTEHYWTPQSNVSNETSTNKTFQRTISAQVHTHTHTRTHDWSSAHSRSLVLCRRPQDTLAYATALLNEKEQSGSSNGSDGSPANDNADRSLRQVRRLGAAAVFNLRLIALHQLGDTRRMGKPTWDIFQPVVLPPTAVTDRLKPPR